jgi:hypothetical protein
LRVIVTLPAEVVGVIVGFIVFVPLKVAPPDVTDVDQLKPE